MDIRIKNLKAKLVTDNKKLLEALRKYFSAPLPGARYTPSYGRGWDGRKYFITPAGTFKIGLLEAVRESLSIIDNLEVTEIDESTWKPVLIDYEASINEFKLYDYQEEAVKEALKRKRLIIKAPTGSGKTLIMAQIVASFPEQMITVLFNSKHLLKQTYEFFQTCGIKDVGVNFGEGFIPGRVMLSTVQSIEGILDPYVAESQVLLVDEAHAFANGKITLAAIESFPNCEYRFGFTATPPTDKYSKYNLIGALGPVYEVRSVQELIDNDKLTKPEISILNFIYSQQEENLSYNLSYPDAYEQFVTNCNKKKKELGKLIQEEGNKLPYTRHLVLVKSLEHLSNIKDYLQDQGLTVFTVEGKDDLTERYRLIDLFRKTNNSVLIGTTVLQTGVSIDEITHFYNMRELKSEIATIQALGRALRKSKHKDKVKVYDFATVSLRYLGGHTLARKRTYKREGYEITEISIP